ncbi:hypothetical protein ACT3SZ_16350 [Corynebacterium sp. AOP40-9SA-29]|uniref:hypothetical protein n=1 Tax=Corynebacterium sp. AOP40-9SA-29 TaxID=3457677 RepID=UPI0040333908
MAVKVITSNPNFAGNNDVYQGTDEFAEDNGLLIVSDKDTRIIAIYNRGCWDSVLVVPDRADG